MKFTRILLTGTAIVFASYVQTANAQTRKGELVVTAGAGQSASGIIVNGATKLFRLAPNSIIEVNKIPVIVGNADYGITNVFSLGVSYAYQSFSIRFTDVPYSSDTTGTWKDKLTRTNAGIRILFHTNPSKNENDDGTGFDLYGGLRIGYKNWSYKTGNTNPDYIVNEVYESLSFFRSRPTVQILGGARYFFTPNLGINGELSIGAPYFAMIGINYKLATAKE